MWIQLYAVQGMFWDHHLILASFWTILVHLRVPSKIKKNQIREQLTLLIMDKTYLTEKEQPVFDAAWWFPMSVLQDISNTFEAFSGNC